MAKLGDYDSWHKPCKKCGFDPCKGKSRRCWKCGSYLQLDYSERALKKGKKP